MFIKLHGVKGARILFNVEHIRAIQEITDDSKYAVNKESGAKSLIQVDDKLVPVRDSITQINHILKNSGLFGAYYKLNPEEYRRNDMAITKNTHYFKGSELYYLKDVLPYIKKMNSKLDIPNCWFQGGSLNEKVRTEYGITPAWENGFEGRGHREKYTGSQMYKIAENLTFDLKAGIIKRRQSRSLTPIEVLASDNKISADEFVGAFGGSAEAIEREVMKNPVVIPPYPVRTKEDVQKALSEAADILVTQFQNFIDQVIKAYMSSI